MSSKVLTPIKAIRANCLGCCCSQRAMVRHCPIVDCNLWPYRLGKRPARHSTPEGILSTEGGVARRDEDGGAK